MSPGVAWRPLRHGQIKQWRSSVWARASIGSIQTNVAGRLGFRWKWRDEYLDRRLGLIRARPAGRLAQRRYEYLGVLGTLGYQSLPRPGCSEQQDGRSPTRDASCQYPSLVLRVLLGLNQGPYRGLVRLSRNLDEYRYGHLLVPWTAPSSWLDPGDDGGLAAPVTSAKSPKHWGASRGCGP